MKKYNLSVLGLMVQKRRVTTTPVFFASLLGCLLLVSCSSDSADEPGTNVGLEAGVVTYRGLPVFGAEGLEADQVQAPWLAVVGTFRIASMTPGTGDAVVEVLKYGDERTLQDHIDWYKGQVDIETCEINEQSTGGNSETDSTPPYVNGGESIVINTPSGTWFAINADEDLIYEVDNELPGPIPAGATLSIPGADFPSVAAYPLLEPAPPVGISPGRNTVVDINSEYSWQAGSDPAAYIYLEFLEYDANDNFLDFRIACQVVDDGSFVLPDNITNYIAGSDNTLYARYAREVRRLDYIDGILFFRIASVAE